MKPDAFWKATKAYPNLEATTYRLYRRWPKIDRRLTGHSYTNIDCQGQMDDRYIRNTWGSGEYKIFFHDANRKGRSEVCYTLIEIDEPEFPPVLDFKELLWTHPKNGSYVEQLAARGVRPPGQEDENDMGESAKLVESVAQALKDNKTPEPSGVRETLGLMAEGFKQVMAHQVNPFEQLKHARELMGGGGDRELFLALLQQQQAAAQQQMTMFLELFKHQTQPATVPAPSLVDQLDQVTAVAERLGLGRGSSESGWMAQLIPYAPALLAGLAGLAARGAAPVPPPAYPPDAPAPTVAPRVAPTPAAAPGPDLSGLSAVLGENVNIPKMLQLAQRALSAYQQGFTGSEFASALERTEGSRTYDEVAEIGREKIMAGLQFSGQIPATELPRIQEFIEDFMAYGEVEEDGGADPAEKGEK